MAYTSIDISKGWMPDLLPEDVLAAGGLLQATNVFPISGSYYPVGSKVPYTSVPVTGTPLKAIYFQDTDGTYYNFIATSTKLFLQSGNSITDVTKLATTYNANYWDFVPYGAWLIATDYEYGPQVLKGMTATNFVNLGGVQAGFGAKYCLMSHGHLVFGFIKDTANGIQPKTICWSGIENPESGFVYDQASGSDTQNMPDILGNITGLASIGNSFAVYAENSISLVDYIGGDFTFSIRQNLIKNIGCFYPGSLISIGMLNFFWSKESIWMFNGSSHPTEIGINIKKTVMPTIDMGHPENISVSHDKANSLIIWMYNSSKLIAYNYNENRWTGPIDISGACIFTGAVGGEQFDSVAFGNTVTDTLDIPVDSSYWDGNTVIPIIVDTDGYIKTLTGASLQTVLETGEVRNGDIIMMVKKGIVPVENLLGTGTLSIAHRYSPTSTIQVSAPSAIKNDGTTDHRISNRRVGAILKVQDFSKIGRTIQLDLVPVGRR